MENNNTNLLLGILIYCHIFLLFEMFINTKMSIERIHHHHHLNQ